MNSPLAFFALFSLTYITCGSSKLICTFEDVNVDTIWCSDPALSVNFLAEDQPVHGLDENSHPREMIASSCRLKWVNGEFFKKLTTINRLDLSKNYIEVLDANMFEHLKGLRYLNLANNFVETIDRMAFFSLANLRVLDVSDNLLTDPKDNVFDGPRRLTILRISRNKYLKKFPSILNKSALKTLHITNTSLNLPAVFDANFPNLLNVDLSYNHELYLDNHATGTLKKCLKLVSFKMSNCQLKSIDEYYFANMTDIVSIDISHNKLFELRANQFSTNPGLNNLDISHNIISGLSMTIFRSNSKLTSLKMARNKLQSLPEKIFDSLVDLEYLDLGYNEIETIPTALFSKTTTMDTLLLDNNKIKTIHPNTFVKMANLRILILPGNSIQRFNYNIISSLKSLIELNIGNNYLTEIPEEFFDNPNNLLILNLSCNMLIDLKLPSNTYLSTKIIIHGNPLNCNCLNSLFRHKELYFSLEWSQKGDHPTCVVGDSGVCDKNINQVGLQSWKRELSYYPGLCRSRI